MASQFAAIYFQTIRFVFPGFWTIRPSLTQAFITELLPSRIFNQSRKPHQFTITFMTLATSRLKVSCIQWLESESLNDIFGILFRNFGIKASIYGLLRLVRKTCKVSVPSAKRKCYNKRILSIKRTTSLTTSLLNICLGCLSSSHDRFRKWEISHSGKGQCPLRNFFPESVFGKQRL